MLKNETLHIRVNENVKTNAENTLKMLGITISDAVNMFLYQIPLVGGVPFDVKIPSAPESVIVRDIKDLYEKLMIGKEQIKNGEVVDADIAMNQLGKKYGF
ncbi:MAG: type II toxin-antitoxin system RelB/DinJ family antitoxin [Defluviitaleaceae bacterium]|nr:type II toxin-antitoxin system RelB/DinJ family antitoxin [Defluviitaleaceae bacterium]